MARYKIYGHGDCERRHRKVRQHREHKSTNDAKGASRRGELNEQVQQARIDRGRKQGCREMVGHGSLVLLHGVVSYKEAVKNRRKKLKTLVYKVLGLLG